MRQWLTANVFKFFHDKCHLHMKDFIEKSFISQASTRNSTMKLSQSLRRTSYGQHYISFLAPSVWNNLLNELKLYINLNTFKHKIKEYLLHKITQKDDAIYFTTRLLSSQQLMHFFSNFSLFVYLLFFFFFFCVLPYLNLATYFVQRPQWI